MYISQIFHAQPDAYTGFRVMPDPSRAIALKPIQTAAS
jgi:hypothetical protein